MNALMWLLHARAIISHDVFSYLCGWCETRHIELASVPQNNI